MKNLVRLGLLFLLSLIISTGHLQAQSCVPTNLNHSVIQLSCNNPCLNLGFQVPHLKATTDYISSSIPYNAFPFDQGTPIPSTYIDDQFSALIPSVFPICFYGQTYNNFIVGSNGVVTFETICANQDNAYPLDDGGVPALPVTIPNASGTGPTTIATLYYPRASIFGPYHDINPATTPLPTRRIEYNVFGTAPCRKLVVSFLDVRMFSCNSAIATSQIVIYENTGIVEVFLKDKPVCSSWNEGFAILGLQDETRTKAVTPPGKNCTVFSETNTGYRFTPSGNTSRYVSAELLDMTGAVVAVADTATTVAGLLDITFPNTCPAANSTQYQVRTTFTSCPIGGNLVSIDTITVVRNNVLPVTAVASNASCGISNGTITVNVAAGAGVAPYQYNINGGALQPGNIFPALAGGTYTIYATDAFGCDTTFSVTVNVTANLTGTISSTGASCPGVNNGTITVTPTAGTGPYSYSLNGGTPQAGNVFTALASGNYTVTFTDALLCTGTLTTTIAPGTSLNASITRTNTACTGATNGAITVNASGGTGPYSYSLNGGTPVVGSPGYTFTGLSAGNYTISITDAGGCAYTSSVQTLVAGPGLTGNANVTPASCPGANNGSIQIQPLSGSSPFTFTINPGGTTNASGIFTGLTGGQTYTITWTSAGSGSCIGTVTRTVGSGASNVTGTAAGTATSCAGAADGTLTVTPTAGGAPYDFSIDGGVTYQTSATFTGLTAGPYTITIRSAGACTGTIATSVTAGASTIASTNVTVPTSCNGASDGSVTVTPTSGTGPYQYNIDGGTFQASNIFTGLSSGSHTVVVRDITTTCTGTFTINIAAGANLAFTNNIMATSCPGINNGAITVTPTNGLAPYSFALDGGTPQASGTFTGLTSGAHTIVFTDVNSCSGTVNFNVSQGAALTVTATTVATSCPGVNNGSATAVPGVAGTYTYALDGGTAQGSPTFTALAAGPHTIVITEPSGCTGTVNFTVTAGAAITGSFTATATTCSAATNGSATATPTNGTGPYTYSLNGGAFGNSASFNNLGSGAHTITIRDNNGCLGNVNVTVPVGAGISASATSTATACPGVNTGTISVTPSAGTAPYSYALDGGTPQASNIFSNVSSGAHTILVTDANGCTFTVNSNVAAGAALTGSFTATATTCNVATNGSATATATNGSAPYTYSLDGGAFQNNNSFTNISSGAHTITIRDNNGCLGDVAVTVPVGNGITATGSTTGTACPGVNNGTISITPAAGTAPYSYALDGGTPQAANNFTNVSSGAHAVLVTDANGCTFTVNVNIAQGAALTGTTAIKPTCLGLSSGTLTVTASSGLAPYSYSIDTGATFQNSNVFTNLPDAAYSIIIRDAAGCTGTTTGTVTVAPPVMAFAGNDTIAVTGVPHQLTGSGGVGYLWSPSTNLDNPFTATPMATITGDTRFYLQVTDFAGCIGRDTILLKVYDGPTYYVPNAFSPNGDGLNDIFRPIPVGISNTQYFRIFNRYGELVFQTNQWLKGWDGTFKGKQQPIGAYIWMIKGTDRNGKDIEMKGTVMMIQ